MITTANNQFQKLTRQLRFRLAYAWAVADQVIFSIGNLLLLSQLSRGLGPITFGRIAIVYSVTSILAAVVRAAFTEVINSTASSEAERAAGDMAARVLTMLVAISLLVVTGVAIAVRGPDVLSIFGIATAVQLIQDRLRYEWIYRRLTFRAFLVDFSWLCGQIVFLAVVATSILSPSPRMAIIAWTVGAAFSLIFFRRMDGRYSFRTSFQWAREHSSASWAASFQSLIISVASFGPIFIFGLTGDPAWSAGYLAAATMLGPQSSVIIALRPLVYRRLADAQGRAPKALVFRLSWRFGMLSVLVGFIAMIGLGVFGHLIYGHSAEFAMMIAPWIAITRSLGAAASVLNGSLRSRGRWGTTLFGELITSVVLIALMLTAAWFLGAIWVSPAQVLGSFFSLLLWGLFAFE